MFTDPNFRMTIEAVFAIRGRGIVVTGLIEDGTIQVGNEIFVHGADSVKTAVISSIEMFRRKQQRAQAGETVGLVLEGIHKKEEVQQGDILKGVPRGE